ncbi:MAG: SEL1-like repeat protein, partial [Alphaproteobacteria bacterium]|nr:SEL1-like repeat protein [Alphaproteobacteria bacterium]
AQIAALADNVDALANQVVAASEKADEVALSSETRFAALDERLRVAERTAFTSASALDHTMENVERLRAMHDSIEVEVRQHAALMEQAKDDWDRLNATVADSSNGHAASLARVEETLERLQAENASDPLDLRLSGIEHVLTDIMGRLEQAEQVSASTGGTVEQTLRDLATGFETADERNRETIRELQLAVEVAATKIAAVERKLSEPPPAPVAVEQPLPQQPPPMGDLILDAPPFPQDQMPGHLSSDLPPLGEHDLSSLTQEFPPAFAESESALPPSAFGEALEDDQYGTPEPGSFLDAARRSAKAAAAEREQIGPGKSGGLNWTFPGKGSEQQKQTGSMKRYALAGSVFGVAVAATLAGVVLSHGVGSTPPDAVRPTAIVQQSAPAATRGTAETELAPAPAMDEGAPGSMPPASKPLPNETSNAAPQAAAELPAQRLHPTARNAAVAAPAAAVAPPAGPLQKLASLANTGDSKAQLLLGLKHLEGSGTPVNEAEAARWLARAAQQGEPLAQYRLGTLYERGRGVAGSPKLAAHWYELAAKQGNRKAMHNLAVAFAEGSGELKDSAQAAVWFSRAAGLGLADSQFNLAVLYERGMGVKQSLVDAYKWYLIAAASGDSESKARADALSTQLSDADRAAAQQAASAFRPQELNPAANSTPSLG